MAQTDESVNRDKAQQTEQTEACLRVEAVPRWNPHARFAQPPCPVLAGRPEAGNNAHVTVELWGGLPLDGRELSLQSPSQLLPLPWRHARLRVRRRTKPKMQ
jgi:hypothetical protein